MIGKFKKLSKDRENYPKCRKIDEIYAQIIKNFTKKTKL